MYIIICYVPIQYESSNLYNSRSTYNCLDTESESRTAVLILFHLLLFEAENEINRPQSIMTPFKNKLRFNFTQTISF